MQLCPKIRPLAPWQPVSNAAVYEIFEQQLNLGTKPVLRFFEEQSVHILCISSRGAGRSFRNTAEISHQSNACSSYSRRWWDVNQLLFENVSVLALDCLQHVLLYLLGSFCLNCADGKQLLSDGPLQSCFRGEGDVDWTCWGSCHKLAYSSHACGQPVRDSWCSWLLSLWSFFSINVFGCNLTAGCAQKIFSTLVLRYQDMLKLSYRPCLQRGLD